MFEILIIQDDRDFSKSLCNMLTRQGYGVVNAENGLDGVNFFKKHPVDLVITDILLPEHDGLNVIFDLKNLFPDVKIIAISGGGHCASGEEYLNDVQLMSNVEYTGVYPKNYQKMM